jgi:hypothetical protein
MGELNDRDWQLLQQIDDGEPVDVPPDSVVRLVAAKFIMLRHDRKAAITGLGRDAVLRKQYNFAPPSENAPAGMADDA